MVNPSARIALLYHPEAYTVQTSKIMGRNVAGESFLRGYLKYGSASTFTAVVENANFGEQFIKLVQSFNRDEPITIIDKQRLGDLRSVDVFQLPVPGIEEQARWRSFWGSRAWSISGITHTTSSARAMDSISRILTSPVQAWDALICTSNAVKSNVEAILSIEAEYLRDRIRASQIILPKLPVIPLGIHSDDFDIDTNARGKVRADMGISDDKVVVLFLGRLSFHAKASPVAMYLALERASKQAGVGVTLVECGWYANEYIKTSFEEAAAELCPSVERIYLDGNQENERLRAWTTADIFCSLSDNIQESFGITPVEAMAAGLPSIVSDWNGYKDTIRDKIDGYRIPTVMPPPGLGRDLAARHALEIDSYDVYLGNAANSVAVDIDAISAAFTQLLRHKNLRQKMGAAAKIRAKEIFDWSQVIPQYEELWNNLAKQRRSANEIYNESKVWPSRSDPFDIFRSYPSQTLDENLILLLAQDDLSTLKETAKRLRSLKIFSVSNLPGIEEIDLVLDHIDRKPCSVKELLSAINTQTPTHTVRILMWLLKVGVLRASVA